jgi:hypothetical protein
MGELMINLLPRHLWCSSTVFQLKFDNVQVFLILNHQHYYYYTTSRLKPYTKLSLACGVVGIQIRGRLPRGIDAGLRICEFELIEPRLRASEGLGIVSLIVHGLTSLGLLIIQRLTIAERLKAANKLGSCGNNGILEDQKVLQLWYHQASRDDTLESEEMTWRCYCARIC